MEVGPENPSGHSRHGVDHVVMIAPVDTDVNETEHVAHEHRQKRLQRFYSIAMWDLHFEHHDRNDDRNDAVAKRFESVLSHFGFESLLTFC